MVIIGLSIALIGGFGLRKVKELDLEGAGEMYAVPMAFGFMLSVCGVFVGVTMVVLSLVLSGV
jgi:hypothetical protein